MEIACQIFHTYLYYDILPFSLVSEESHGTIYLSTNEAERKKTIIVYSKNFI
jgi:hypothetical protein